MSLFELDLPLRKVKLDKAARRMRALGQPAPHDNPTKLEAAGLPPDLFAHALGTIGGGNHFCEVQKIASTTDVQQFDPAATYLLVHSGSRGLGTAILASLPENASNGLSAPPAETYRVAHDQAMGWARLNRAGIAQRAAEALNATCQLVVDAPHNMLAATAAGWLHRKGAAQANGLVPVAGSRASPSYVVRALDHPDALGSLAHGAGRRYDRASMHGRVRGKKSDLSAMTRTALGSRVICEDRDMLIEEAPQAYKSAQAVVADLKRTGVAVPHTIFHPLLTFKKTKPEEE